MAQERIALWRPGETLNLSCLGLERLPLNLPAGLSRLSCHRNQLTSLENLPVGLERLSCSNNQLTSLENLPTGLNYLDCYHNQLNSLDNLPAALKRLHCSRNQLTSLGNLPPSLKWLYCSGNPLPFFSIEEWRKIQSIRRRLALIRFQQTYRRRLIRRRVRSKTPINYAIFARPGLGQGWLEACRDVGIDPSSFDVERYRLNSAE